ncbi:MAG: hypothetical protein ACTHU0_39240 [Kofleriaceae bacterium]
MSDYFNFAGLDVDEDPESFSRSFSGYGENCGGAFDVSVDDAARALLAQQALMGFSLNPFKVVKKVAQGATRAAYNLARGKRPWAAVGPSGKPMTPTDVRQAALRAGLPPPEPGQDAYAQQDPYAQQPYAPGPLPPPMTDAEYAQLYPYGPPMMGGSPRRRRR